MRFILAGRSAIGPTEVNAGPRAARLGNLRRRSWLMSVGAPDIALDLFHNDWTAVSHDGET